MATTLTPIALRELEELLRGSRRHTAEVYREWKAGLTVQTMAENRGHEDLKKVKDTLSALRILFGREPLPRQGKGRQQAINEASSFLNSDLYLSPELQKHLEGILKKAEKTNTRRDGYESPTPPSYRSIYDEARANTREGDQSGIYVLTKASYMELHEKLGKPLMVKIGWSNNVWDRVSNAQTWEPDPLELLRIYPCENPEPIEARIHICLDTLGLNYKGGGGKEWFQTDLETIDVLARNLGLQAQDKNKIDP